MSSRKLFIDDERGKFKLTKTRIIQLDIAGVYWRWVYLDDLKKHLPVNGVDTARGPDGHWISLKDGGFPLPLRWIGISEHDIDVTDFGRDERGPFAYWWLAVSSTGVLQIGCKHFTAAETRAIYKAAGIEREVID